MSEALKRRVLAPFLMACLRQNWLYQPNNTFVYIAHR